MLVQTAAAVMAAAVVRDFFSARADLECLRVLACPHSTSAPLVSGRLELDQIGAKVQLVCHGSLRWAILRFLFAVAG